MVVAIAIVPWSPWYVPPKMIPLLVYGGEVPTMVWFVYVQIFTLPHGTKRYNITIDYHGTIMVPW